MRACCMRGRLTWLWSLGAVEGDFVRVHLSSGRSCAIEAEEAWICSCNPMSFLGILCHSIRWDNPSKRMYDLQAVRARDLSYCIGAETLYVSRMSAVCQVLQH